MKIVLSYIHYPMALPRYFDNALRRRDDVELFTVGPYTGAWIPWAGGKTLPIKYAKPPDLPLPINGGMPCVPIDYIERQLPWQPDLWLQIDAGFYFRGKPQHGKNVIVGTDPHALDYNPQHELADTFYCMQSPYMCPGDVYLPYAYDPAVHYPESQPRNYDAVLLGIHYEQRNKLVEALRQQGLNIHYGQGPIFDEAREIYNQAPIALAWSSKDDLCARVFEGMAMGRVVVTNRVTDLGRFFDDCDLISFRTLGEAIEKVMSYYNDPSDLSEMAKNGLATVKPHTYDARVEQIINEL